MLAKTNPSSIERAENVDGDRVEALGNPSLGFALFEHGADSFLRGLVGELELRWGVDLDDLDGVGQRGGRGDPDLGVAGLAVGLVGGDVDLQLIADAGADQTFAEAGDRTACRR